MHVDHLVGRALQPPGGESPLLTANIVMPAAGDTAAGTAGFGRLLLALSSLALTRFGAAGEDHRPAAPGESVPLCLAGAPANPFDGQLLRFREAGGDYQFHSIGPDVTKSPSPNDRCDGGTECSLRII